MKYLYQNKHWELNKEYNIDKILYLMIDRPSEINIYNDDFIWTNNKEQLHREYDLPSYISIYYCKQYSLYWYKSYKLHRKKFKPAIIEDDGYKEYYVNGKFIRTETIK